MKTKIFLTLFLSLIAFTFFNPANGQGWTFTFQMYASGDCGGAQPPPIVVPNMGIPTKSQCQSLRQQVLAVTVSGGGCTVGYTCGECTGSDIVYPGQSSPGEVSFAGPTEGQPFFTPHPSSAFEDWAKYYKQQQESLGFASYLGSAYTPPPIPLTDNPEFNKFYGDEVMSFEKPEQGGAVDLSGKYSDDFLTKKVVIPEEYSNYNNEIDNVYSTKLIDMPKLPDGEREITNGVVEGIDKTREVLVDVAGLLPPGLNYATIAAVDGVAPLANVIYNCAIRTPPECPPSSGEKEAEKAIINMLGDIGSAAVGDLGAGVLKGFKGFNEVSLITDAKKAGIGLIEDASHYKTMPPNQLWNLVVSQKKDIKADVIPSVAGVTGTKILDYFKTEKNDW